MKHTVKVEIKDWMIYALLLGLSQYIQIKYKIPIKLPKEEELSDFMPSKRCWLRHKYVTIVAQIFPVAEPGGNILSQRDISDITVITLKCRRCGKLKQKRLLGYITLEEIKGINGKTSKVC